MEPKFIVNTTIDAQCQMEASKGLAPKSAKVMNYIIFAILGVLLVVSVWQYIEQRESSMLYTLLLLAGTLLLLVFFQFRAPHSATRRWEANLRKSFGTNALHVHTEFYDLTLSQTMAENDSCIEEGYSVISAMKETENLFLLRRGKQQWFFIAKDGFTKGTPDEYRAFILARIGS